jgi:hypothetical protein
MGNKSNANKILVLKTEVSVYVGQVDMVERESSVSDSGGLWVNGA